MRTVKLKGRTVIKKNKENYRDPGVKAVPVQCGFTPGVSLMSMVCFQNAVLVLAPLQ